MTVLDAPSLAGSRRRAQRVIAHLPDDLSGAEVVLNCRGLLAAAVSFADELVKQILVVRGAALLRVVEVSDAEFVNYLKARAKAQGVSDRLQFDS